MIAALLALALPACGSANSTETQQTAPARPSAGQAPEASAQRGGNGFALKKIGEFEHPVYVTGAPGFPKLLFVVEQAGRVAVLSGRQALGPPVPRHPRQGPLRRRRAGLLSIAFPPDYATSKSFYVYYNDEAGNIHIDEFKSSSPTRAGAGSRRPVIEIPHAENPNHNGGQLQFLGDLLYFATGDGGSGGDPPNNAQNKDVLLGKLLRIDPRPSGGAPYTVPSSNPFVGGPGRDEIYSYGLRNPFRFSFDTIGAKQPRIAIGDVGQNQFEELDYTTVAAASGANFGWDAIEGFAPYTEGSSGTADPGDTVKPILAYPHSRAGSSCSIIGGYVVRRPQPRLALQALRLRRSLRGPAAQPGPAPERRWRRPQDRRRRRKPHLLRRRHPGSPLRGHARRAGLPARAPLKRPHGPRPTGKVG